MKTIQSKAGELILVPIPKEAIQFWIDRQFNNLYWSDTKNEGRYKRTGKIKSCLVELNVSTKTNIEIIGLSSQLTEEQAKELVEEKTIWMDIIRYQGDEISYVYAKEALHSLIESSDIVLTEDQDCLILLKKEK